MLSNIFIVAFISLLIKENNAGCNSTCQKECIDVINKYRINHQAKRVAFSQSLADKAQKWADGGRFGYDMKSRGKFGQLIEWDVKGELNNFTAVIKHWHDKERDFDFKSGRSRTGKTLHDFTQIVWKRAQKAGCGQSEIFGSKYYVVWMDSEGIFRPNVSDSATNVGAPKKEDLHWYETGVKRKPTRLVHSKLKEESSSSRAVVAPDGSTANTAAKVQYGLRKSFKDPDLNEMQDRQKALNIKPLLKQYLYHDNLNNIVLDENKDTASYHVVPGTEDKANWQKGAESLVQLGDSESKNDKKTPVIDNANVGTIPNEDEDVRKQASRFQSMVIQDDELLAKDAEGENKEPVSSEGNGGTELGETYEEKQADAIQSVMSQEDDMIQHENDDAFDESTGNNSSASPKMFQRKPISYFASGVALNNNPIASSFPGMDSKPFLDSSSVTYNIMLNDDTTEKEPHNETPKKEGLQSNSSTLSFAETKSTTVAEGETNVTTNKQEQKVGTARDPTALSEANGIKMTGEKLIANLNSQLSAPASSRFPQNGNTTGTGNTVKSTSSNVVDAVSSTSRLHQVTSPAVITLPNSSSRPIKLVFHLKDMKGLDRSSQVYQQLARMDNDLEQHLNDVAECHDDTLQCKLWATNGHCRGIAYAEFMKRHCKATCGYCGLPSIIKETSKLTKNISLSQDEPCEDAPGYEFSCAKWQEQGYCEKREKEMRSFCGKTCGFCVASHSSKGTSLRLPPKPGPFLESGVHLLSDKPDSNVYPPTITEKPVSMSLESLRASRNNALKIVKEGSTVSASNLRFGSRLGPNDGSISKQNGDSSGQLPKEQSRGDETVDRNQLHSQPPRLSQSNLVKVPVRVKAHGRINPQPFSLNQNSLSQQFTANKEDELIEKGIKALQNRVQAPLEISAIAKSKPGCGHRLCKEKVKTQQAKTRATVKNRGMSGINTTINAREKAVATKGCDVRCQQECLSAHNRYRVNHRAPPLKLDQTLANQAQQWADKKVFKHSPWAGGQGGETIALGSLYPTFTAAVKAWHDEEKDYNWSTGTGDGGMKVNHFTQVVWKRALLLGCGRTLVNGEPYYIAQMDTPGVIAGVPGFDKSNVGKPKEPDLHWFMESSPYWKEMQTKDSIPKNVEHRILR